MRPDPLEDVRRVARAYGLDVEPLLALLAPFLPSYLELALDDGGFEIITGGRGVARELASAAASLGLEAPARDAFLLAASRAPEVMVGLKVDAARRAPPTLYHRAMLPLGEGLALLGEEGLPEHVREALAHRLAPAQTLYGLGFSTAGGALRVKTYVLGDVAGRVGFRSVRATAAGVEIDERVYEANADARATGLGCARRAERALGASVLGHVGRSPARGAKVYVERVGAIPTDTSAR